MKTAFVRYLLNGVLFTLIGPFFFWLAYPIGVVPAWFVVEASCHALRFASFRWFVFPGDSGYRVTPVRYLASTLPVSLFVLIVLMLFEGVLGRTALTLLGAAISVVAGFLLSWLTYLPGRFWSAAGRD